MTRSDDAQTAKQRLVWNRAAPGYDRMMALFDRSWFEGGREWICARARGRVLEVAIGSGRNLEHYRPDVVLTGIDLSPAMLAIARERAAAIARQVDLHEGDASRLPFDDNCFDTVVCVLSLCSIPEPAQAIAQMHRVLVPGGRLLLLDHVGSTWPPLYAGQWLVEQLARRIGGEYLTRRQLPSVERAGFIVEETQRLKAGTVERIRARKMSHVDEIS